MKSKNFLFKWLVLFFAAGTLIASCSSDDDDDANNNVTPSNTTGNSSDKESSFATNSTDSTFSNAVVIVFSDDSTAVVKSNPYSSSGVTVSIDSNHVSVTSTYASAVNYVLSGSTTNGSLSVNSSNDFQVILNGVSLISSQGPAIYLSSTSDASLRSVGTTNNRLIDNATYASAYSSAKGAVYSAGNLTITGSGQLTVKGYNRHAIASAQKVTVAGGYNTISAAPKDGIHATNVEQTGGTLTVSATGDAIEAEDGSLTISGGTLTATASVQDTKGLKADSTVTISGGDVSVTASGNQTKAIKANDVVVSAGTLNITTTGDVVLESSGSGYDPSYCTGIKSDNNTTISGGTVTITSSGKSGKGVSTDGDFYLTGGTLNISTTGNGGTYTDSDGATDSYAATGVSVDGNAYIYGGTAIPYLRQVVPEKEYPLMVN